MLLTLACFPFLGVEVGQDQEFTIDTRGAGGQGKLDVTILSPSRKVVQCLVAPVAGRESNTAKFIPREEGLYAIDVTYDGHPVPGSPYTMEASLPPDPTKVSLCFCSRMRLIVVKMYTVISLSGFLSVESLWKIPLYGCQAVDDDHPSTVVGQEPLGRRDLSLPLSVLFLQDFGVGTPTSMS